MFQVVLSFFCFVQMILVVGPYDVSSGRSRRAECNGMRDDADTVMPDSKKWLSKAERHPQGVVNFDHAMVWHSTGRTGLASFRVHKQAVIKGSDLNTYEDRIQRQACFACGYTHVGGVIAFQMSGVYAHNNSDHKRLFVDGVARQRGRGGNRFAPGRGPASN